MFCCFKKTRKVYHRTSCYQVAVGDVILGGYHNVAIQSMIKIKTSNVNTVINQINKLVNLGCDLVRVAVYDEKDAQALKQICIKSKCPIIADIHFNFLFAIKAIEAGCKKIRINPDNINDIDQLKQIIEKAKEYKVAIRIGINGGSTSKNSGVETQSQLVKRMLNWVNFFEKQNFKNLVLSIKHSDPQLTYKANVLLASKTRYPIHIGATEAGPNDLAIVKSCSLLLPLLNKGIGCTIRVSINGNPEQEVYIARAILNQAGLYHNFVNIIACPLCGRNKFNTIKIVNKVHQYLKDKKCHLSIAIMGCVVNGLGEANLADIGICIISATKSILFIKGKKVKTINNNNINSELKAYIAKFTKK